MDAALERARCDRRDVVDEALRRHLGQFHRHVAADRDEVIALVVPHRVKHPVVVVVLEQNLLAALHVEGTHRRVRQTDRHPRAVRRPTDTVQRVEPDRDRHRQLPAADSPNLNLPRARRQPAGHRQLFAVRRKLHLLHALRQPDQAGGQAGAVGVVQQHLMITGHSNQRAVRRVVDRRDDRRQAVHRRVVLVVALLGARRRVVGRTLSNPTGDHRDLPCVQRIALLRHLRLAVDRRDERDQLALVRLARHDRLVLALAARKQLGESRHHILALGLGRLMAAVALALENRPDVAVKTDLLRLGLLGVGAYRCREQRRHDPL